MDINKIYNVDCLEGMKQMPDKSIDLILTDPPYNIGKAEWDKIPDYIPWCTAWLKECDRVLKDTGSLYIWHNHMPQIANIMKTIESNTNFEFRQFCVWEKPNFRKHIWGNPGKGNELKNWFNICEYCLYYTKGNKGALRRINNNPERCRAIKEWYEKEKKRLGLEEKDIRKKYTEETGRKPHMLRHYFKDSQFEVPSKKVWESVYMPLGFGKTYECITQEYENQKEEYKEKTRERAGLMPVHRLDALHSNVWRSEQITGCESNGKHHICEKPLDILRRIIRTSAREGDTVLDLFMGSGSTALAALMENRNYIGFETSKQYCEIAEKRIEEYKLSYTE